MFTKGVFDYLPFILFRYSFYSPFIRLHLKTVYASNSESILVVFSIYSAPVLLFRYPDGDILWHEEHISLTLGTFLQISSKLLISYWESRVFYHW